MRAVKNECCPTAVRFEVVAALLLILCLSLIIGMTGCAGGSAALSLASASTSNSGAGAPPPPPNPGPTPNPTPESSKEVVYVAANTQKRIYGFEFDENTGTMESLPDFPITIAGFPQQIAAASAQKFLFVPSFVPASETNPSSASQLLTYKINSAGGLSLAEQTNGQFGAAITDPSSQFLYAVSSLQGPNVISGFQIDQNGRLTEIVGSPFPSAPAPSEFVSSPDGTLLFSGFQSGRGAGIQVFLRSRSGTLTKFKQTGIDKAPNGLFVHPSGNFLLATYNDGTLFVYNIASDGSLTPTSSSPVAVGKEPFTVMTDATGRFVLVSNPGSDSISVFSMNPATGDIREIPGSPFAAGQTPSFLSFSSTQHYLLAVQRDIGTLIVLKFDPNSGELKQTGTSYPVAPGSGNIVIVP